MVVEYDPAWPQRFERLRREYAGAMAAAGVPVVAIEHVGSTSVRGLAAKPVIDCDMVVAGQHVAAASQALIRLGFKPLGELGIPLRWAFKEPERLAGTNTYIVAEGSLSLRNHLAVRDILRADADLREQYAAVKKRASAAIEMDNAQVAVADYRPDWWPANTFLLIRRARLAPEQVSADPRSRRRRTLHPGQRAVPIPELARAEVIYGYSFILTNLDVTSPDKTAAAEHWYRHRTTIENLFRDESTEPPSVTSRPDIPRSIPPGCGARCSPPPWPPGCTSSLPPPAARPSWPATAPAAAKP